MWKILCSLFDKVCHCLRTSCIHMAWKTFIYIIHFVRMLCMNGFQRPEPSLCDVDCVGSDIYRSIAQFLVIGRFRVESLASPKAWAPLPRSLTSADLHTMCGRCHWSETIPVRRANRSEPTGRLEPVLSRDQTPTLAPPPPLPGY